MSEKIRSKNNKKLLYIIDKIEYGGAQIGMTRLLNELENYNITVATFYIEEEELAESLPEDINVTNLKIREYWQFYKIRALIKHVKNSDIIIGSLWNSTVIGTLLAKIYGKQIINWRHNSVYQSKIRKISYLLCYQLSNAILADSMLVEKSIKKMKVSNSKISTVPISGVDTAKYKKNQKSSSKLKVTTIGRITEQKGYGTLIKVAKHLGNIEFTIIGKGGREKVKEFIKSPLPHNITVKEDLSERELLEHLQASSIYFQPSNWEGLCITVIEAMSCQLPVVASSVGGIQDSVIHGETGYKAEPKSVDEFCEYIEELAENPEKREEFGEKGRERVKENYSAEELKTKFEDALNSLS